MQWAVMKTAHSSLVLNVQRLLPGEFRREHFRDVSNMPSFIRLHGKDSLPEALVSGNAQKLREDAHDADHPHDLAIARNQRLANVLFEH